MAIDNLNDIVNHYKLLNNIQSIPSKLKIYEMTEFIRENEEKRNVKDLAKDVVKAIFSPDLSDTKLTEKQKFDVDVKRKVDEMNYKILKKHAKKV
jgi:ribosomal protein L7/L12